MRARGCASRRLGSFAHRLRASGSVCGSHRPPRPHGGAPPPPPPRAVAWAPAVSPAVSPAARRFCQRGFQQQPPHPPAFCPPVFRCPIAHVAGVGFGSADTVRGGQRPHPSRSGSRLGGPAASAPRRSARPPCLAEVDVPESILRIYHFLLNINL